MKTPSLVAKNAIYRELQYDVFSAIVTEALIRSCPLDKGELAKYTDNLRDYVRNSLVNMNALQMVEEALVSDSHTDIQKAYLYNLSDALTVIPHEAATRIANETAGVQSLSDAIGDRKFTEAEMSRLTKKVDDLTIPELSRVINRKVTAVLKDEKNAYEQEQILQKELSDMVKKNNEEVASKLGEDGFTQPVNGNFGDENDENGKTKDAGKDGEPPAGSGDTEEPDVIEEDESLDSYLNLILEKNDPRHHISFFSRLQDMAMETLMTSGVKVTDELPIPVLESLIERAIPAYHKPDNSIDQDFEILNTAMESAACNTPCNTEMDDARIAHICSIVMYNLLETLNTMNVYHPTTNSVCQFVDGKPCVSTPDQVANHLSDSVADTVNSIKRRLKTMSPQEVGIAFDSCTNLKEKISNMTSKYPALEKNLPSLEAMIETLRQKISDNVKLPAAESFFTTRQRNENISQFSKLMSVWGKRPDVREIRFTPETATESTCVNVDIVGGNGVKLGRTTMFLNRMDSFGSLENIVTECVGASTLMKSDKLLTLNDPKAGRLTTLKERF